MTVISKGIGNVDACSCGTVKLQLSWVTCDFDIHQGSKNRVSRNRNQLSSLWIAVIVYFCFPVKYVQLLWLEVNREEPIVYDDGHDCWATTTWWFETFDWRTVFETGEAKRRSSFPLLSYLG